MRSLINILSLNAKQEHLREQWEVWLSGSGLCRQCRLGAGAQPYAESDREAVDNFGPPVKCVILEDELVQGSHAETEQDAGQETQAAQLLCPLILHTAQIIAWPLLHTTASTWRCADADTAWRD